MIGGWLLKLVIVIALIGFLIVEVGSPLIAHAQVDGIAHDAADNAATEYRASSNVDLARGRCGQIAQDKSVKILVCDPDTNDPAVWHVTVEKEARSVLFKRWSVLAKYYDVKVSATSQKRGNGDKL